MKKFTLIPLVLTIALILGACSDGPTTIDLGTGQQASSKKQFVYNAMDYWYYWVGDVPELADGFFENDQAKQNYLNTFSDAQALFNELIYEQEDDFSFFIENYVEFEKSQQGISESFGYNFGLVCQANPCNEIFGYVQYVLPNSPAEQAGLQRGDVFTRVNGTRLTVNNYRNLLFSTTSYELTLAEPQPDGTLNETSETVSLQAVTLQENPIFLSKVFDMGASKIGYIMYNAFQTNSHQNLNNVFGTFLSKGVNELVVDLRYNGGGAVITSAILAGMISGLDTTNVFAQFIFNDKRSVQNQSFPIYNYIPGENDSEIPMNQLSITRVYFLVGFGTASASEALINGVDPYMQLTLIGGETVGKDEGSLTLYDAPAPYTNKNAANPNHKIAIQPIILKIVNKNGRNYPTGFQPDFAVSEISYLFNNQDLPPLGSKDDPLLAKALEEITGQPLAKAERATAPNAYKGFIFIDSQSITQTGNGMYIEPYMLPSSVKTEF